MNDISRRSFLGAGALAALWPHYYQLASAEKGRLKIRDLQTMTIQGPGRTYCLVKVTAGDVYGVAEAYGTPAVGVKEQVLAMKPWLVGKDPLEIDVLYTSLDLHSRNLAGTRTDGSAHNLMRAASGIEMALWDLAGKALGVPASTLLGGRFRKRVRVYDHASPRNMLDRFPPYKSASRPGARPGQPRADHPGADPDTPGL
jgi:L-alanine-DL-glutamate epimerase-like enolase superfamily enzyme